MNNNLYQLITEDKEVIEYTKELRKFDKQISDIYRTVNNRHLQYVDLVLEGGGMLGIATAGFIYALEKANIRFLNTAGSSAGAIIATILSINDLNVQKSEEIIKIMNMNFNNFVDGSFFQRKLSKQLGKNKKNIPLLLFYSLIALPRLLINKNGMGLNRGNMLKDVFNTILETHGIYSTQDLYNSLNKQNVVNYKYSKVGMSIAKKLSIISADIVNQRKVVFPDMGSLYFDDDDVSNYIRSSISIPFYFDAVNSKEDSILVDGGLLSNFPIDIFHVSDRMPTRPTFGVRLHSKEEEKNSFDNGIGYIFSLLNTMKQHSDMDFISTNQEYNKVIAFIDTKEHNFINFEMDDDEKIELFKKGIGSAVQFINNFNWIEYKEIRQLMLNLNSKNIQLVW